MNTGSMYGGVPDFRGQVPPGHVTPQNDRWYKGEHFNVLPSKDGIRRDGLDGTLHGWKPSEPIVRADTRVFAMGSCFAAHFIAWLNARGFGAPDFLPSIWPFENVAVIAQQFRWAFGDARSDDLLWIDRDKQIVEATEERRATLRAALLKAEVVILTLGLSEIWYDRVTDEPLWRAVPERYLDMDRHRFKVLSVAETVGHLETIERVRAEHAPHLKIVYTVSPVRLRATFRPVSALTANAASKAIIRAGLDEFLRSRWEQVGRDYFYFPSYELVTDVLPAPYEPDNLHVAGATVARVLDLFARHYTSLPTEGDDGFPSEADDLRARIAELEARSGELQRVCDERLAVIGELDTAARERLAVINELDARCRALESARTTA